MPFSLYIKYWHLKLKLPHFYSVPPFLWDMIGLTYYIYKIKVYSITLLNIAEGI